MTDEPVKACKECGEVKPLLDFPTRKDQPDGHHWLCFDCKRAKDREYGKVHRARNSEAQRRYDRRWARKPEVRELRRKQAIRDKYGLTQDAFDAKLAAQDGRCPLCPPDDDGHKEWHVDHDHAHCPGQNTCGQCLRDVLCRRHNMGLGYFDDDPELLRAAAEYIERHRARIQAAGSVPWEPRGVAAAEQHYNWKGAAAGRTALQVRVRKALGNADHCQDGCEAASRFVWVLRHGADPTDLASYFQLCQGCSVRHYGQAGSAHVRAKLTAEQAAEIRARYVPGQSPTQADLAREYGVSQGVISSVIRNEKYVA